MECEPENAVDKIKGGLWIGGIRSLVDLNVVEHMDAVISIVELNRIPEPIYNLCTRGKPSLRVEVADGDLTLIDHLPRISRFISAHKRLNHNILIHCMAGRSRSVIVLAYYMVTRMAYPTLHDALEKILSRRPSVEPKPQLLLATQAYLDRTWYAKIPRSPTAPRMKKTK
jgi:protein-tyrosine phosphatase